MSDDPQRVVRVGPGIHVGNQRPITVFAGVNVLESLALSLRVGAQLKATTDALGLKLVFKASWDKANRSALSSYRGPGLEQGLRWLREIRTELDVPVITDIHEPLQASVVSEYVDVMQIPAFLSRQTDLLAAACATGKPVLIKKMQMMAPRDVANIIDKCRGLGCEDVLLCERGTSFGYGNLVVDPLAFNEMMQLGAPVVFDVTHALQQPGALGHRTGGRGPQSVPLAMAGVSQGIAGLFFECHPEPSKALCDGPCALPLDDVEALLSRVAAMDMLVKSWA